jgi:uncharacterized membrane protein YidH (DUF202 family)
MTTPAADQSGVLRDVLASHRTLLAYIRTSLSFAGLGFAVAKFGLNPGQARTAAAIGTAMVLIGLGLTIVGLAEHRALLRRLEPEPAGGRGHSRALHLAAGIGSALVCTALAVYLITSAA